MKTKTWINLIASLGLLVASFGVTPLRVPFAQAATIVRVKPGGSTSAGCGSSWATACELQTALTAAITGDEIWVAAGTYNPGTNREDTFKLKNNVALYGGFIGTETARGQRDWEANLTVLSGDIGVPDDSSDNSYHVVNGSAYATAILDGFTITGGNADSSPSNDRGGGMYIFIGSPTLTNITFSSNYADFYGGGMYIGQGFSSPSLTNVTFNDNKARQGGGMLNNDSSPTLTDVVFSGNQADSGGGLHNLMSNPTLTNVTFSGNLAETGGGMYNYESSPSLTNGTFIGNQAIYVGGGIYNHTNCNVTLMDVTFRGNVAGNIGGGMYNGYSSPSLTDVTFIGNSATRGGGMANDGDRPTLTNVTISSNQADYGGGIYNLHASSPTIANTILWGNTARLSYPQIFNEDTSATYIQYTDVQGGCGAIASNDCSGGGNTNADPRFVRNPHPGPDGTWGTADDDYGDLRLQNGSPAIDAGDNTAPGLVGVTTDLDGNPRFEDFACIVDTGVGPPPVVDMGAYEKQTTNAPTALGDGYSTNEEVSLHIGAPGVLVNDCDPNSDPLNAMMENGTTSGSLTLNPDGSFDYLPKKDYYGVVTFAYRATDGSLNSNTATVTITVSNVNDAPVAVNDTYNTSEDTNLHIDAPGVLGNDSDSDGDSLSAVLVSGPSSGSLTLHPNGSFDYLPEKDYHGVVTFTYRTTDGSLNSKIAIDTITVSSINDSPVSFNDTYITPENTKLTINSPGVLGNDSDPDGDSLTAVLVSGPSSGSLTLNPNGSFDYLPELNYSGAVTFTYWATDGSNNSNTATATITVSSVNEAPFAVNDTYGTSKAANLHINAPGVLMNDSDPDGNPVSAVLENGPSSGSLTLNPDGSFDYLPDKDFSGDITFTYCASDGLLESNHAMVTITVSKTGREIYLPMLIR